MSFWLDPTVERRFEIVVSGFLLPFISKHVLRCFLFFLYIMCHTGLYPMVPTTLPPQHLWRPVPIFHLLHRPFQDGITARHVANLLPSCFSSGEAFPSDEVSSARMLIQDLRNNEHRSLISSTEAEVDCLSGWKTSFTNCFGVITPEWTLHSSKDMLWGFLSILLLASLYI